MYDPMNDPWRGTIFSAFNFNEEFDALGDLRERRMWLIVDPHDNSIMFTEGGELMGFTSWLRAKEFAANSGGPCVVATVNLGWAKLVKQFGGLVSHVAIDHPGVMSRVLHATITAVPEVSDWLPSSVPAFADLPFDELHNVPKHLLN